MAPPLSVSQITTLNASFAEDIRAYEQARLDGIGIWELKLPADSDDGQALELFAASGLASAAAVRVRLEPHQREGGEEWTIVGSIRDAGDPAAVGIQFDVWHLWNSETLYDDIEQELERFVSVQVCDYRNPTRAGQTVRFRATGRPTCRASSQRWTPRAGTACTTSRSSPTTARSGPRLRTRSGPCRRRSRSNALVRRSSVAGQTCPRQ